MIREKAIIERTILREREWQLHTERGKYNDRKHNDLSLIVEREKDKRENSEKLERCKTSK